jgi:hypothetical protein
MIEEENNMIGGARPEEMNAAKNGPNSEDFYKAYDILTLINISKSKAYNLIYLSDEYLHNISLSSEKSNLINYLINQIFRGKLITEDLQHIPAEDTGTPYILSPYETRTTITRADIQKIDRKLKADKHNFHSYLTKVLQQNTEFSRIFNHLKGVRNLGDVSIEEFYDRTRFINSPEYINNKKIQLEIDIRILASKYIFITEKYTDLKYYPQIRSGLLDIFIEYPNDSADTKLRNMLAVLREINRYLNTDDFLMVYQLCMDVDNSTDIFTSVLTESNKELLMYNIHSENVTNMVNPIISYILDLNSYAENIIVPSIEILLPKKPTGGALNDACTGQMIINPETKPAFIISGIVKTFDELLHDFTGFFSSETLTILKPIYLNNISDLTTIFDGFIRSSNPSADKDELEKIKQLITLIQSYSAGRETEWNYYTAVLQYIDLTCNRLDELNVVKCASVSSMNLSPASIDFLKTTGYIIEIQSGDGGEADDDEGKDFFYTTIDNQPVRPIFTINDVNFRVSDNNTSYQKLLPLIYETNDDTADKRLITVSDKNELIANMYDIQYAPGLLDPKTIGSYKLNTHFFGPDINTKINAMGTLSDQSRLSLKKIQQLQNINYVSAFHARRFLTDGINIFIEYFGSKSNIDVVSSQDPYTAEIAYINNGVDLGLLNPIDYFPNAAGYTSPPSLNIDFISIVQNEYIGVKFNLNNPGHHSQELIYLHYGDTTIKNVSNYINSFPNKVVTSSVVGDIDPSWQRLYAFARAIFEGIPSTNRPKYSETDYSDKFITQIIISLKSFGDSLQVYYAKRLNLFLSEFVNIKSLFITTTDKNVAAESLLINSPFWLIGTGIRPHMDFYNDHKEFFNQDYFKDFLTGVKGIPANDPIFTKINMDGTKTLTTNKSLATVDKYIDSIFNTFFKIAEYVPTNTRFEEFIKQVVEIKEREDYLTNSPIAKIGYIQKIYNGNLFDSIFVEKGKQFIKQIFNKIGVAADLEIETKQLLNELDGFLKKTYDILKLGNKPPQNFEETADFAIDKSKLDRLDRYEAKINSEVNATLDSIMTIIIISAEAKTGSEFIESTKEKKVTMEAPVITSNLLIKKLDTMSDLISKKIVLLAPLIIKKEPGIFMSQIENIKTSITGSVTKPIIDPTFVNFTSEYLSSSYNGMFKDISDKYNVIIEKNKQTLTEYLDIFKKSFEEKTVVIREKHGREATSQATASSLDTKIAAALRESAALRKIESKLAIQENKLQEIIASYNPNKKKSMLSKFLEFTTITKSDEKKIEKIRGTIGKDEKTKTDEIAKITADVTLKFNKSESTKNNSVARGMVRTILTDINNTFTRINTNIIGAFKDAFKSAVDEDVTKKGGNKKLNKTIKRVSKKYYKKTKKHHKKKVKYYKNTIKYKRNKKQKNTKKFK